MQDPRVFIESFNARLWYVLARLFVNNNDALLSCSSHIRIYRDQHFCKKMYVSKLLVRSKKLFMRGIFSLCLTFVPTLIFSNFKRFFSDRYNFFEKINVSKELIGWHSGFAGRNLYYDVFQRPNLCYIEIILANSVLRLSRPIYLKKIYFELKLHNFCVGF